MELKDKKVLVLGLAKSGKAAVRLLSYFGAKITINESKQKEEIPEYEDYINQGIEMIVGSQPESLFEREFDFVVKNPGINYHMWFIDRLRERNIPIYTEIELGYLVAKPQNYIAITGTNGKTTTVSLLYEIYKHAQRNVHVGGNYGIAYCDIVMDYHLYEEANHDIILEMSNFQLLDIHKFHPHLSTVLNLTPDHLDYMRNLDEYYASKMRIYKNCDNQDIYIENLDDSTLHDYLNQYPNKSKRVTFSINKHANMYLKGRDIYYQDSLFIHRDELKIVGLHNVQNAMAASLLALSNGISKEVVIETLKTFTGVKHRLQFVQEVKGVKYYNDSKGTNTDACVIAIKAFEKPIILLMGGHEKHLDVKDVKAMNDSIKTLITFGEAGLRFKEDMQHPNSYYCKKMKDAVLKAYELSEPGDIVVLSPSTSSFDEFNNMAERGDQFIQIVGQLS